MDVTPFLVCFIENVYHKLVSALPSPNTTETFQNALSQGDLTKKEQALWHFVLTAYGTGQFSTKQLEKDFGHAAYATIRGFVLKLPKPFRPFAGQGPMILCRNNILPDKMSTIQAASAVL